MNTGAVDGYRLRATAFATGVAPATLKRQLKYAKVKVVRKRGAKRS